MNGKSLFELVTSMISGVALVCCLPVVAHATPLVRGRPNLAGVWQLNRKLSTNGRSELPGHLNQEIVPVNETESWTFAEVDNRTSELLEATELLEIFVGGKEVTVNATGGTDVVLTRTFSTQGATITEQTGSSNARTTHAFWQDEQLVIETQSNAGTSIVEKYKLDRDTDLLYVQIRIENSSCTQPLIVDRVYDRIGNRNSKGAVAIISNVPVPSFARGKRRRNLFTSPFAVRKRR